MTPVDILKKAVQQALDGGWTVNDWVDADDFEWEIEAGDFEGDTPCMKYGGMGEEFYLGIGSLMLDHDFAKALWGDGWAWFTEGQSGDTLPSGNYINWQGHIANMAVAEDAIAYLAKNI